ncbi:TetR/AcrR family transcriptional regulator [Mycolicibacterium hippocampi]|uniref:TetR/AcrR family transcriptional regulator n=1 Tax=Mycolicibacterium hippocampi TaxID=659824 RepID=UPI003516CAEF
MTADVGKREAHKIATRRAIQAAADALFAARGYSNTTVRDIADAAGVTERTLFRYFPDKEALLIKDIEERIPILGAEIKRRPAEEAPLRAVENAFFSLAGQLGDAQPNVSWLFQDGPPGPKLAKSAPGLLMRFEQQIADALLHRCRRQGAGGADDEFRMQVLARCAVAALRSAGIRQWQLSRRGDDDAPPGAAELIGQAFDVLRRAGD